MIRSVKEAVIVAAKVYGEGAVGVEKRLPNIV
jgi:hypothetical protein